MYFWPRNSMVLPKMLYEKYLWVKNEKNVKKKGKKITKFFPIFNSE